MDNKMFQFDSTQSVPQTENDSEKPLITESDKQNDPHLEIHKDGSQEHENAESSQSEGQKRLKSSFSAPNLSFWERMSLKAKNIAYNWLKPAEKSMPNETTNNIFAKVEIFGKTTMMEHYESNATKRAKKIEKANDKIEDLQEDIAEIMEDIKTSEDFVEKATLNERLSKKTEKLNKLLDKKRNDLSDWENNDKRMRQFSNERMTIAAHMVSRYETTLAPMEGHLKSLGDAKKTIDEQIEEMGINHEKQKNKIVALENEKMIKEKRCLSRGYSNKEIKEATERLDNKINKILEEMRLEQKTLYNERNEITAAITKLDEQANPYRDKRDYYAREMQKKPLSADFETEKAENADYRPLDIKASSRY